MAADAALDSTVRQRKPEKTPETPEGETPRTKKVSIKDLDDADDYTPWVDVLRVLSFLFLASMGLSYVVTNGESLFWQFKVPPKYLQVEYWKAQWRGPIYLTPEELAAYDGSDPTKPLYLAINGTIYDVTPGARVYGPGGSYHVFAGVDAARAYVTGCFQDDRTPDMRGVEEMFLPLDDPEVDAHFTRGQLKSLREQEMRVAKKKVHDALQHWVDFYGHSKKYSKVGYVVREEGWLDKEPRRTLCEPAAKGRKPRTLPADKKN